MKLQQSAKQSLKSSPNLFLFEYKHINLQLIVVVGINDQHFCLSN